METPTRPGRFLTSSVVAMAVLVMLPILAGLSAYASDLTHRLEIARGERAGLHRIMQLNRLMADLLRYRSLKICQTCAGTAVNAARAAVDADIASVDAAQKHQPLAVTDWAGVRTAWTRYRAQSHVNPTTSSQLFADFIRSYVHVSDESGLTYDPDTSGIDIADALTYRLPPAIDFLQRSSLEARARSTSTLERALAVVDDRARAHVFLADMFSDLDEVTHLRPHESATLVPVLRDATAALARSDRTFSDFVRRPDAVWTAANSAAAQRTMNAMLSIEHTSTPVLDDMLRRRILVYRHALWLMLVPGVAGLGAALLIVLFAALALRHRTSLQLAESLASIDALTSVVSRRKFDLTLESQREHSVQAGTPLSLIVIDVDHFKAFNDAYGHVSGDICLRRVAQAAAACMRNAQDVLARYGGEEFVAILPSTELADAVQVAERIRLAIYELGIPHQGTSLKRITVSVGVSSDVPDGGTTNQSLVDQADYWLYRAKETGRNRVCAAGYTSLAPAANQRCATA